MPQAWQWWRLRVREKSQPQFMHIITCVTGTRVGGLSPRLTPSLSRIWSSGIGQAAGSGDQLDGRPPYPVRGVYVCGRGGLHFYRLPCNPQGADLGYKQSPRCQAVGCTVITLSRARGGPRALMEGEARPCG